MFLLFSLFMPYIIVLVRRCKVTLFSWTGKIYFAKWRKGCTFAKK